MFFGHRPDMVVRGGKAPKFLLIHYIAAFIVAMRNPWTERINGTVSVEHNPRCSTLLSGESVLESHSVARFQHSPRPHFSAWFDRDASNSHLTGLPTPFSPRHTVHGISVSKLNLKTLSLVDKVHLSSQNSPSQIETVLTQPPTHPETLSLNRRCLLVSVYINPMYNDLVICLVSTLLGTGRGGTRASQPLTSAILEKLMM